LISNRPSDRQSEIRAYVPLGKCTNQRCFNVSELFEQFDEIICFWERRVFFRKQYNLPRI